ncbi:hypothetical protein PUN28_017422 [Cardiocondyla obscurior]|uniref:Transmembrane protein n=1 Tax=Cardiocondyla obscurior TaxID=286306 RepID=A0AAW2ES60_9HYME
MCSNLFVGLTHYRCSQLFSQKLSFLSADNFYPLIYSLLLCIYAGLTRAVFASRDRRVTRSLKHSQTRPAAGLGAPSISVRKHARVITYWPRRQIPRRRRRRVEEAQETRKGGRGKNGRSRERKAETISPATDDNDGAA